MSDNEDKLIQLSTEKKSNNFFTKDLEYKKITPFATRNEKTKFIKFFKLWSNNLF